MQSVQRRQRRPRHKPASAQIHIYGENMPTHSIWVVYMLPDERTKHQHQRKVREGASQCQDLYHRVRRSRRGRRRAKSRKREVQNTSKSVNMWVESKMRVELCRADGRPRVGWRDMGAGLMVWMAQPKQSRANTHLHTHTHFSFQI